jgi:nicotinamidase-related amidase
MVASVVHLLNYRKQADQPVLVLVGLQESHLLGLEPEVASNALARCAEALTAARAQQTPVAFVRCIAPPASISEPRIYPAWLKGFEPQRNDLVFDVLQPSCYSNAEFSRTMDHYEGNFVIAGLFAETTCLATAVDAHHRRHRFTYLSDASASRSNGTIPAALFHDAVSQVVSLYGAVAESPDWSFGLPQNRRRQ